MKHKWCFTLKDGSEPIYSYYTDEEIEAFRIKYPEVKFPYAYKYEGQKV